jgi:hypothetical protein
VVQKPHTIHLTLVFHLTEVDTECLKLTDHKATINEEYDITGGPLSLHWMSHKGRSIGSKAGVGGHYYLHESLANEIFPNGLSTISYRQAVTLTNDCE